MRSLSDVELDRLLATLKQAGAPIATRLNPGLSRSEQDAIVGPAGIELSEEARVWWGWRNGVDLDAAKPAATSLGWVTPLSLQAAIEEAAMMAQISAQTAVDGYDPWDPNWLPLVGTEGASITCDCGAGTAQASPVRFIDLEMGVESFDPVFGSIGELVEFWIEALERKFIEYDAARGDWSTNEPWPGMPEDFKAFV